MAIEVISVVDARAKLGEGAVWDEREKCLWWVDIMGHLIHRYDPVTGKDQIFDVKEPVGCLAVREDDGLVIATQSGFYFYYPETGQKSPIVDPEADKPNNRFNDGATDRVGRFWAGTMKFIGEREPVGCFYRLDHDLHCEEVIHDISVTNGLAFSPDGKTMYAADTDASVQTIWAFDYSEETGTPTNPRVFFDTSGIEGRPDGGTVDADGNYWFAAVGGWQVVQLSPEGKIMQQIDVPVEKPTKVAFGGLDMELLFVTSISDGIDTSRKQPKAGNLLLIEGLDARGIPDQRFLG